MTASKCPACLNGCGGARSDCPQREGGPLVRPAIGRPSSYTEDVAEEILEGLMEGKSLRQLCEQVGMPHRSTVIRWLSENDAFATKYARAREAQADYMDDKILETAEACTVDTFQADKVKIAAWQWRAEKLKPKVYGSKVTQEHTGPGGGPMTAVVLTVDDPIEAAKQYQRLMGE